ncbi:sigma-70 family RNA polymerase sigma factor [Streptomyces sp. CAU 1734]|uniref:RNA polymerase sigma factor n=1 Tax=Streptomyces sp. CAU 1734 TaxID=3140360 RepID=UPI0032613B31
MTSEDDYPPAPYWAMHAQYHQPWLEYTTVQLGSDKDAQDLVDDLFVYLAIIWPAFIQKENVGTYAWRLLKERVAGELRLQGRDPAAAETLAFERAIRAATTPILDDFRTRFRTEYTLTPEFEGQITELEDSLRLFAAMARLPERQFDVMVLQYALDFDTRTTALVMGIKESTVRSTSRTAKLRLATDLGLTIDEDENADGEE